MLQSWENFMSPSGGNMENSLHFGVPSLFAEFGAGLAVKHVFEPLRAREIRETETRLKRKGRLIQNRGVRLRSHVTSVAGFEDAVSMNDIRGQAPKAITEPRNRHRVAKRIHGINSRYNKLKFGAKAIGWGYVALAAASIMESATTPGLTKSAEMNNAQTMGMAPPLDSSQAYTQRQRALMAIHDSQLGIRNVIGSEAGYLHR
jgi:hypothetical protein